jgi:simple sugar transport system permease protein
MPLDDTYTIGNISDAFEVHWGLAAGAIACLLAWVLLRYSVAGFSLGVVGVTCVPRV